jgi:predicted methyltransferase
MNKLWRHRWLVGVAVIALAALAASAVAQREDASRDTWQRPVEVMDALQIQAGSRVADVGCGEGYFVMHLAQRVGPGGAVYAVDIDEGALSRLRKKVEAARLENVQIIRGKDDDPLLPAGEFDAVLIVNAYHEMKEYDAMLRAIYSALRPGGRLGIIDAAGDESKSRSAHVRAHTMAEPMVREEAERNGFRFDRKEQGFERRESDRRYWFFLIFTK